MLTAVAKKLFNDHLEQAAQERRHFYSNNDLAETNLEHCSMIIDGMTQNTTALPHFDRTIKGLDKNQVDVHCVGSIISSVGSFMEFSYGNLANNACLLVDTIHRNINRVQSHRSSKDQRMPTVMHIQLDNCSTNKSKTLMAYASYLVMTGVFKRIEISFMMVGHTHENIDQLFSRFSVKLRTLRCYTLNSLMEAAKASLPTNPPVVEHVEGMNDWDSFLKEYVNPDGDNTFMNFTSLKPQHVFLISAHPDNPTKPLLRAKMLSSHTTWSPAEGLEILLEARSPGRPPTRKTEPLSDEARVAMAEIRTGLEDLLGTDYVGEVKDYWDGLSSSMRVPIPKPTLSSRTFLMSWWWIHH